MSDIDAIEQLAVPRVSEYLRYHVESARAGDIDPGHAMLKYICNRFELNCEQRYWLAWLYAMTYCGPSAYYIYNEFPDYENVDVGRMQRWWDARGRAEMICQTDRRWVRSSSLFVPAFESYRAWVGDGTQHEHFSQFMTFKSPELRYELLYDSAKVLYSFGQFALFLYLEALHTITDLDLCPTDLDLEKAWSCRNGLYYTYGLDDLVDDKETRIRPGAHALTQKKWTELRATLAGLEIPPTVWQTETMLCAYRKFHRGKRYIGYYLDRQAIEIAKMQDHVSRGVCWDVLWDYRRETYEKAYLAETLMCVSERGLTREWKKHVVSRTNAVLEQS